jgi:glycosyltransferase involved in cell wall biosynthesis
MGFLVPSFVKMPSDFAPPVPAEMITGFDDFLHPGDFVVSHQRAIGVLHLINGEHFSGAERVQQHLGRKLPESCIDPYFVCLKDGKFPQMCGLDEDHVRAMPMRSRTDLSIVSRIAKFARELELELIHAHTPRSAMIASLVARRLGIPWVFHVHSPTARDSTRSWINRVNDWIERVSLFRCDHVITVSRSLRREMLSRGFARSKLSCIPNGVVCQDPIDPFTRINQTEWNLGMVALIRPRKGIEVLLEALAIVVRDNHHVKLDVSGPFETSAYEAEVLKLVDKLQLQGVVRFRGFTQDVPAAMRTLDGMVLPSLFGEGMPMVVLEAMALGVPVIATRVEGTPEVVRHGMEGYLATPRDPKSLATEILRFVSSRSAWTTMSQKAVERQQLKYSDDEMASKTAQIYRRVLARR